MTDDGTPYPFAMGPTDNGYKLKINNMAHIVQHILPMVSGFESKTATFNTLSELNNIEWVKNFSRNDGFYRFSICKDYASSVLMAEYESGQRWLVVGTLHDADWLDKELPTWKPKEKTEAIKPNNMKPFNLEEALAGKPVVTRDGRPVKIAGYNPEALYSLVGWVDKSHGSWRTDGSYFDYGTSDSDLFMAPEKKTVWVALVEVLHQCCTVTARTYNTEQEASQSIANAQSIGKKTYGVHPIEIEI